MKLASSFKFWPLISPQGDGNGFPCDRASDCHGHVLALNFPARGRKRYLPALSPSQEGVLALNFPARGRKRICLGGRASAVGGVLALNFPARGRKRLPWGLATFLYLKFWPLISPQGDGNQAQSGFDGSQSLVLALNFPARGRKPEAHRDPKYHGACQFWPLISPQGDGNWKHCPEMPSKLAFWPLISPQGDGNHCVRRRAARGLESFWPLISPQGDGNVKTQNSITFDPMGFGP